MKKNNPTLTSAWKNLTSHFNELKNIEMKQMFADGKKAEDFTLNWEDFTVDFSKNRITKKTLGLLFNLASECNLQQSIEDQFSGKKINQTEGRAVLHTAVRAEKNKKIFVDNKDVGPQILEYRKKINSIE